MAKADTLMPKPLAIDMFCGLGGWTEGLLAEGWDVIGFDIEQHIYAVPDVPDGDGSKGMNPVPKRGWSQGCAVSLGMEGATKRPDTKLLRYPAQLVLQDVLTLHGAQFKTVDLIVASPPCQEYSYMAMPWSRAKAIAAEYREGKRDVKQLTALFDACFRIQREAIEAAGHFIPLVVENVRGAIPWVGRSRWNYGSFHLWGDVPALMPMTSKGVKVGGISFSGYGTPGYKAVAFNGTAEARMREEIKNNGGSWFNIGGPGQKVCGMNPDGRKGANGSWFGDYQAMKDGVKQGGDWFNADQPSISRMCSSKSSKRKAASAMIAKIPLPLSRHIAAYWHPRRAVA